MATLTDFTDAQTEPAVKVKQDRLHQLFVAAEAALRLAIYGTRDTGVEHDHGARGGMNLLRALWSVTIGTYVRPGSAAAPVQGVPLGPPQGGVSMVATPKLVAHVGVLLPGGVNAAAIRLAVHLPGAGTRTVDLQAELRAFGRAGYGPGKGIPSGGTLTATGANDYQDIRLTMSPLAALGAPNGNRWLELLVWQGSNPPAASAYRLLGALGQWLTAPQGTPPPPAGGMPAAPVGVVEVQAGAFVTESLGRKLRAALTGLIYGALGQVPGLFLLPSWGTLEDKGRSWRKVIGRYIHGHTGKLEGDGAIVPGTYAAGFFPNDLGDDVSGNVTAAMAKGEKIDPSASGTVSGCTAFTLRVPVAKGLRRIEIRAALRPETSSQIGKLTVFARALQITQDAVFSASFDISTTMIAGDNPSGGRAGGFLGVEVDPEDGDAWQLNMARRAFGRYGHWTTDALLSDQPTGIRSDSLYRVTQAIYLDVEPVSTRDVVLDIRFCLKDSAGASVSAARLQWVSAGPAPGF
jgi:hypothetical protein